jgi:hypothetical protein
MRDQAQVPFQMNQRLLAVCGITALLLISQQVDSPAFEATAPKAEVRKILSLDADWRFLKMDSSLPVRTKKVGRQSISGKSRCDL